MCSVFAAGSSTPWKNLPRPRAETRPGGVGNGAAVSRLEHRARFIGVTLGSAKARGASRVCSNYVLPLLVRLRQGLSRVVHAHFKRAARHAASAMVRERGGVYIPVISHTA